MMSCWTDEGMSSRLHQTGKKYSCLPIIDVSSLEKKERELEDLFQRLSTIVAICEKCNEEWFRLLNKMKGDVKLEEEKEYC